MYLTSAVTHSSRSIIVKWELENETVSIQRNLELEHFDVEGIAH